MSKQPPPMDPAYVRAHYDGFFADPAVDYAYDRWERTPESKYHFAQSRRAFERAVASLHVENALEVGCGDGVWTRLFAPHVQRLTCLDLSKEMLQRAQAKLASLPTPIVFRQGDFLENGLPAASFDAVLAFRCFEYFADPQAGLREFFRLLRPGGTLVLATKSRHFDWRGYFSKRPLHQGVADIPALRDALERAGFAVKEVYPAIVGKGLAHPFGRWIGDRLQAFLTFARSWFPLALSRYVVESYVFVAAKRAAATEPR